MWFLKQQNSIYCVRKKDYKKFKIFSKKVLTKRFCCGNILFVAGEYTLVSMPAKTSDVGA